MAVFIILVISIALGVLLSWFMRKHGVGKWVRRPLATAVGMLVFLAALGTYLGNTATATTSVAATPQPAPSTTSAIQSLAPAVAKPLFTTINPSAKAAARKYIARVDHAITDTLARADRGPMSTREAHDTSVYFKSLASEGETQFGEFGDPLGYCGMAGTYAQQFWTLALSAGFGSQSFVRGLNQARDALASYHEYRGYCLDKAKT